MMQVVVCGPGSQAGSQPKPDVKSRCRTGPITWPGRAHGLGFNFGMRLTQAQSPALNLEAVV
jgi:hypothetical protein